MFGNIGGLISTWSYPVWDAPDFHIGNGLNLACASMILIIGLSAWFWMHWDNVVREEKNIEEELVGMSPEDIKELDWKHPAFRWNL